MTIPTPPRQNNIPFRETETLSERIVNREKFRSLAMRGTSVIPHEMGELPGAWQIAFRAENPSYVVISFETPIAWYSDRLGWTVPNVKYTRTTSRHQQVVREAVKKNPSNIESL